MKVLFREVTAAAAAVCAAARELLPAPRQTLVPQRSRQQLVELVDVQEATIAALASAIDAKHHASDDHIRQVRVLSTALAGHLGLSAGEIDAIRMAAALHDIGKLAVPATVLQKPGPLTAEEFDLVRVHPRVGADIIATVPFPYPVAPLVLGHHERWDGRGYPSGLTGEEIPLGARILAVVDSYDSLMRARPHRGALARDAALATLQSESGRAFDPRVVEAFLEILPDVRTTEADALRDAPRDTALETIRHTHREVVALYDLSRAISSSLDVTDLARLLGGRLHNLIPYTSYAFYLADETGTVLSCLHADGQDAGLLEHVHITVGRGAVGRAMRDRKALVDGDPSEDLLAVAAERELQTTGLRSCLATPLANPTRLLGAVALYHTRAGHFDQRHRRLLDQVATQAAVVLHNSLRFERAREESLTDPLTGLPNTRFFSMHLTQEIARARRQRSQLALLLLDLDEFKRINDTYGHPAGDRTLRVLAQTLRGSIRPYDVCARYAGDEFVVMLPECGVVEAEERRHDLEDVISHLRVPLDSGHQIQISGSIGAAVFPLDGDSYEDLLAAADSRMYRRKARPIDPPLAASSSDGGSSQSI